MRPTLLLALLPLLAPAALAGERYVAAPYSRLVFADEPPRPPQTPWSGVLASQLEACEPYVVLDGGGEAWLEWAGAGVNAGTDRTPWQRELPGIAVRTENDAPVAGTLYYPKPDLSGFAAHRFTLAADAQTGAAAEQRFLLAMEDHYARLVARDVPGAAWFRHRLREVRAQIPERASSDEPAEMPGWTPHAHELDDTLDLFSGERAIAENLELDRVLRVAKEDAEPTVAIDTLPGITTRELDWAALTKDLKPELDPLARLVPADQHAVFFPSFEAMTRVMDEADALGSPLLAFVSGRTNDERSKERYQEQLGLPLSQLARLFGPAVVNSVAITGSDPFLPSGTDVAVLFDCKQPEVLEAWVRARHATATEDLGALAGRGHAGSVQFQSAVTPDRRVSSYLARVGDVVIVANSQAQLERVLQVAAGQVAPLTGAGEYVWFRERYQRGQDGESAFLVLTDAAIRRWCSARWRIGESRRVRAAAAMSAIEAAHLAQVVEGRVEAGASAADARWPITADFAWARNGVSSPTYGHLGFLTPVLELGIEKVTPAEAAAYARFRDAYQRAWSAYFDPIAVRIGVSDAALEADVTVMPLQLGSEYAELQRFARGGTLGATAGDPHDGALLHFATAFQPDAELSGMVSALAGSAAGKLGGDPLNWIGDGVALYAEKDPFWAEWRAQKESASFLEKNFYRLPLVLYAEVKDPLRLTAFLTALRAFSSEAAPGITAWSTLTWSEQPYVKIGLDDTSDLAQEYPDAAIYYVATGKAFALSFREDLIHAVIDRQKAARAEGAPPKRAWLGTSSGLFLDREALTDLARLFDTDPAEAGRSAAWAALPILDEWRRLYPDRDPVALHEAVWHQRVVPPGDALAWDPQWQRTTSRVWGSPSAPLQGPALPAAVEALRAASFGLTFESLGGAQGLRARVRVERE